VEDFDLTLNPKFHPNYRLQAIILLVVDLWNQDQSNWLLNNFRVLGFRLFTKATDG